MRARPGPPVAGSGGASKVTRVHQTAHREADLISRYLGLCAKATVVRNRLSNLREPTSYIMIYTRYTASWTLNNGIIFCYYFSYYNWHTVAPRSDYLKRIEHYCRQFQLIESARKKSNNSSLYAASAIYGIDNSNYWASSKITHPDNFNWLIVS